MHFNHGICRVLLGLVREALWHCCLGVATFVCLFGNRALVLLGLVREALWICCLGVTRWPCGPCLAAPSLVRCYLVLCIGMKTATGSAMGVGNKGPRQRPLCWSWSAAATHMSRQELRPEGLTLFCISVKTTDQAFYTSDPVLAQVGKACCGTYKACSALHGACWGVHKACSGAHEPRRGQCKPHTRQSKPQTEDNRPYTRRIQSWPKACCSTY